MTMQKNNLEEILILNEHMASIWKQFLNLLPSDSGPNLDPEKIHSPSKLKKGAQMLKNIRQIREKINYLWLHPPI